MSEESGHKRRRKPGPLAGRVRDVAAGPESYDDQEAIRLHRQRLVDGYAAACERLPRGFTMSFAVWISTIGDAGTLWKDEAWRSLRTTLEPEWML